MDKPTSPTSNKPKTDEECVEAVIQALRTVKVGQIRHQLEDDLKSDVRRYCEVVKFVTAALDK